MKNLIAIIYIFAKGKLFFEDLRLKCQQKLHV